MECCSMLKSAGHSFSNWSYSVGSGTSKNSSAASCSPFKLARPSGFSTSSSTRRPSSIFLTSPGCWTSVLILFFPLWDNLISRVKSPDENSEEQFPVLAPNSSRNAANYKNNEGCMNKNLKIIRIKNCNPKLVMERYQQLSQAYGW